VIRALLSLGVVASLLQPTTYIVMGAPAHRTLMPHILCRPTDASYLTEEAIVARLLDFSAKPSQGRPYVSQLMPEEMVHPFRLTYMDWNRLKDILRCKLKKPEPLIALVKTHSLAVTSNRGTSYTIEGQLQAHRYAPGTIKILWEAVAEVLGFSDPTSGRADARQAHVYISDHEQRHQFFRWHWGDQRVKEFRTLVWRGDSRAEDLFLQKVARLWGDPPNAVGNDKGLLPWPHEALMRWRTEEFLVQAMEAYARDGNLKSLFEQLSYSDDMDLHRGAAPWLTKSVYAIGMPASLFLEVRLRYVQAARVHQIVEARIEQKVAEFQHQYAALRSQRIDHDLWQNLVKFEPSAFGSQSHLYAIQLFNLRHLSSFHIPRSEPELNTPLVVSLTLSRAA